MSDPGSRAPLFVDAFDLCEWLLGRFGDDTRTLPRRLCGHALQLLEVLTLALKGRRREEHLQIADERLILVRTHAIPCLSTPISTFPLEGEGDIAAFGSRFY